MFTNDDYIVEQYIKPQKVGKKLINDERADILGNFDDDVDKTGKKKIKKSKEKITIVTEENPFADGDESENDNEQNSDHEDDNDEEIEDENDEESGDGDDGDDVENGDESDEEIEHVNGANDDDEDVADEDESMEKTSNEDLESDGVQSEPESKVPDATQPKVKNKKTNSADKAQPNKPKKPEKKLDLSDDQLKSLMRGASKKDKFVLYVTNLNYSTTRDALTEFFSVAGTVKSVRIPKVRRNAFAFIEMNDISGFKVNIITYKRHPI